MIDRLRKLSGGASKRAERKRLLYTLEETAAKAVVTASVTFAVGLLLKKMFERSCCAGGGRGR